MIYQNSTMFSVCLRSWNPIKLYTWVWQSCCLYFPTRLKNIIFDYVHHTFLFNQRQCHKSAQSSLNFSKFLSLGTPIHSLVHQNVNAASCYRQFFTGTCYNRPENILVSLSLWTAQSRHWFIDALLLINVKVALPLLELLVYVYCHVYQDYIQFSMFTIL